MNTEAANKFISENLSLCIYGLEEHSSGSRSLIVEQVAKVSEVTYDAAVLVLIQVLINCTREAIKLNKKNIFTK